MSGGRTTRVGSVLVVSWLAATALLGPGGAAAQPADPTDPSGPPVVDGGMATPPPLAPDVPVPADDGLPDKDYVQKTQCVSRQPTATMVDRKPWGQDLLRVGDLSRFATGAGQTVAVIDTGVSPHDNLGARLTGGGDYVARGGTGLEDCDGHGTLVAGIIAADTGEEVGFKGIAPAAGIVSIRQSSRNFQFEDAASNTRGGAGSIPTLTKAVVRAANTPGVTVINMSVNSCRPISDGPIKPEELALQSALRYAVEEKDIVVVASAGNFPEGTTCTEQNGPDPRNPTHLVMPSWFSEYVLSVAAMTRSGAVAGFSIQGPWVSVAAPGTEIVSLDPADPSRLANQLVDQQGKAAPIEGTSFAAPYVAGLAALVRDRFEDLTAKQVMHRIKATAAHPAARGGRDNLVGHGMVDPIAALTAFIPQEKNIPPDTAIDVPFEMPPPHERDWTPMHVAMIGSGGGLGLLLLTLFVVHTVRRNRQ